MENLYIPATASEPEVDFRFDTHSLTLKGESFPENAAAFYVPVIATVESYLAGRSDTTIQVNVTLAYFNSSSTKMLFSLFEILNNAVLSGNVVVLNWFYDEDDDTILEFGEEIADDFAALEFRPQALV